MRDVGIDCRGCGKQSKLDSLLDLAVAACNRGEVEQAHASWQEANQLDPRSVRVHAVRGLILTAAGQTGVAIEAYERALALDPRNVESLYNLALLEFGAGRGTAALERLNLVVELEPTMVDAQRWRILILTELGDTEAAIVSADSALAVLPDAIEIVVARAAALRLAGKIEAALADLDAALLRAPEHGRAWTEKGYALHALGRYAEGLDAFDHALEDEESLYALIGLGLVELDQGMGQAALAAFDRALVLNPENFDASFYRAQTLEMLGDFDQALAAYEDVLVRRPDFAFAYNNIGKIRRDMGLIDDALSALRRAMAIEPDDPRIHSNLLLTLLYDPAQHPEDLVREHAAWGRRFGQPTGRFSEWDNDRDPARPLRIGFVSAELCRHAVSDWLLAIIGALDRSRFTVICYSNNARSDGTTARFMELVDSWRLVVGMDDRRLAEQVRADAVDILIDISGHTALNRLGSFALKPAPVQATWLGYPFTTGLEAIDYSIMDEVAVAPGEEQRFAETVIRLSPSRFCYEPPAYAPLPVEPPVLRQEWITFGSFNNVAKLTGDVLALWCRLLRQLPSARLILKSPSLDNPSVATRIREIIRGAEIPADRFELRGASDNANVLRQYGDVDIALDPFPFGGGATSCEALWMGVPIITLPGWQPVSRQTETLLRAIGRAEWVARDADDYIDIAVHLASEPLRLAKYRADQRQVMARSALCDRRLFGHEIEKTLRAMWERFCTQSRASTQMSGPDQSPLWTTEPLTPGKSMGPPPPDNTRT